MRGSSVQVAWLSGMVLLAAGCSSGGTELAGRCRRQNELVPPSDLAAEAADLVALANEVRSAKAAPPLQVDTGLEDKARRWAATMAAEGRLYHSRVPDGIEARWEKLAENVGEGGDARHVHDGFVQSPPHYSNLVDPAFTHVGVGVATSASGMRYVTEVFMRAAQPAPAEAAAASSPAPQPAPAPAPTTPSTARRAPATSPTIRSPAAAPPPTTAGAPPTSSTTAPAPATVAPAPAPVSTPGPLTVPGRPTACVRPAGKDRR